MKPVSPTVAMKSFATKKGEFQFIGRLIPN